MSDQFTEVTTKSWGSRIVDSIVGVLFGILLFLGSFVVLYMNEGRVDVSKIAKTAIEIEPTSEAPVDANGKLVSTTGTFKSDEKLGDVFLKEGDYISLKRIVEMYAWEETKHSDSHKNFGGSETTKTTYSYSKKWTRFPENSSQFKESSGHHNPEMTIKKKNITISHADLGIYGVDTDKLTLPECNSEIQLNKVNTILDQGFKIADPKYMFKGEGTISEPQIGDLRISYLAVDNPIVPATIFGKLDGPEKQISPYYGVKDTKLYRVFEGSRDGAVVTMHEEYTFTLWMLRLLGFVMMWLGLMLLFRPISVVLDVVPILGSIGMAAIGLTTFGISFVLSLVTILVSMILHNVIVLVGVIAAFVVGILWYLRSKRENNGYEKLPN